MHQLEEVLRTRISAGLKRKTVTKCSVWAESYRVMGQPFAGPFGFQHHPWSREMHDCEAETMVGQKAAQMAYTEVGLNKSFYSIDVKGTSVLYVLPAAHPDATDFSTGRFDPALELSTHLQNLFSDVKNIGHKRAGSANLFIRGSRSRSQLKSVPAGLVVLDEVDEMNQENIPLVFERMSGQLEKQSYLLSTPTIDNFGINLYYKASTQDHYMFRCPSCSKWTELVFPECLVMTATDLFDSKIENSHLICKECKNRLEHASKIEWLTNGKWISSYTDRAIRGFYISQLYSMTMRPAEITASYIRAQSNPADEQELYNSKLGITHTVEGAKITDADILACTGLHKKMLTSPVNSLITIGIDVGKWLHYEIDQWFIEREGFDINTSSKCRLIAEGKIEHFEQLDKLMFDYGIHYAVIDANPERRMAMGFAQRFTGRVKLCFYGRGVQGKTINIHTEEEYTITVDRTAWMDMSLGRLRARRMIFPIDLSLEYKDHIKAPVRIYEKDTDGNLVGRYVKGNEDDHFAHARNYAEIALPLGGALMGHKDVTGVY